MVNIAKDVSSEKYKQASRERVLEIARKNGYSEDDLEVRTRGPRFFKKAPCLRIPFISDSFNFQLQSIFLKYGLTINIMPSSPPTLKQRLVRSRIYDRECHRTSCPDCTHRAGLCMIKGAVYELSCLDCGEKYIGEAGRPLVDRIKEHLADLEHYNRTKPWSTHRREKHGGKEIKFSVVVRSVERRIQERKVKEALLIKLEKPAINARNEMVEAMKFVNIL